MATPTPTDVKKATGLATIDASMIVIKTKDDEPKTYGFNSSQKVVIEANIETLEAIKLIIKGVVEAQRPEKRILTGSTITITNLETIMEMLPLCNGGELTKDTSTKAITGYKAPIAGTESKRTKFDLYVYQAIMSGSSTTGYLETHFPSCEGQPVVMGAEDDVFQQSEYTIISAPGDGERAFETITVDSLPELTGGLPA